MTAHFLRYRGVRPGFSVLPQFINRPPSVCCLPSLDYQLRVLEGLSLLRFFFFPTVTLRIDSCGPAQSCLGLISMSGTHEWPVLFRTVSTCQCYHRGFFWGRANTRVPHRSAFVLLWWVVLSSRNIRFRKAVPSDPHYLF